MRKILNRFACSAFILIMLVGCGETVRIPYDNSKKLAELDEKIKIAKEKTKKAEDDLKKTKEKVTDLQKKIPKASGDEKVKLEKAAQDLQKALAEHDKKIKEITVGSIVALFDTIDQSDINKRKIAYESLPKHEYKGDILKTYFAGGDKPKEQGFQSLEQNELNQIQEDLVQVLMILF
jgi:hypothetical protein